MAGKSRVLYRGQDSGGVPGKFYLYISGSLKILGMSCVWMQFSDSAERTSARGIMEKTASCEISDDMEAGCMNYVFVELELMVKFADGV